MADVDALAAAHLASPSPSTLAAVADLVTAGGHEALQQLVGALGPQLTGTDERERSQATLLLADVLSRIPLAALPADSVAHLTDFFCKAILFQDALLHSIHKISLFCSGPPKL